MEMDKNVSRFLQATVDDRFSDKGKYPCDIPDRLTPAAVEQRSNSIMHVKNGCRSEITLVFTDVHGKFRDVNAMRLMYKVAKDIQPDKVICLGDLIDWYSISRFDKNPKRKYSFQEEVNDMNTLLDEFKEVFGDKEFIWIEGNHEYRLTKILMDAKMEPFKDFEEFRMEKLFDLDKRNIKYTKYNHVIIPDKLFAIHGDHGGGSAKSNFNKYLASGVSGHTHRMSRYEKSVGISRKYVWQECGCMCSFALDYVADPDWQLGFSIIERYPDRDLFDIIEVPIWGDYAHGEYVCNLHGKWYTLENGEIWRGPRENTTNVK